ncbi:MAG: hypothetical protein HOL17_12830, partial [Gammaproteobacteria bacterium]|nr:hypothetical protein [Gammaproteobacteria bacterium]
MKKQTKKIMGLGVVLSTLLLQGCGIMGGSPLIPANTQFRVMPVQVEPGLINKYTQFLAEQIARNRDTYNVSNNPVAITSFVNLENLKHTNKLGELLADNMIHEMQIR